MTINFTWKKIALVATGLLFVALILFGGTQDGGLATILTFIGKLCTFTIQAVFVTGMALGIMYGVARIRSTEWFDRYGSGTEIATARRRVGSPDERPGDLWACGLQYLSNSIILAVVVYSFFAANT